MVRTALATWAFPPRMGCMEFAAWVRCPIEFQFILQRGYIMLDGQRADLFDPTDPHYCDPKSGFMRFRFREPFVMGGLERELELAA